MELFVSTTASARATTPLSFASLHRRPSPSVAVPIRRRLQTRGPEASLALSLARWRSVLAAVSFPGWRCASAAVPDPVPSEEPASASASTVVVAEKPAVAADEEKSWEVGVVSGGSGGTVEATVVPAPASSEASEEDGGIDDILSKLDIEVTPTYVLYGSGAFVVLLALSSVVSAIDSIPLLPKVLELVGIGYSIWFTKRYLLFKENRDELFAKFQDLKERIV